VWFQLLCLASGAGILYFFYRLRVQQATVHVQGRLKNGWRNASASPRTARHLLQVSGLDAAFSGCMKQIPDREPARLT